MTGSVAAGSARRVCIEVDVSFVHLLLWPVVVYSFSSRGGGADVWLSACGAGRQTGRLT
jgi:hypothetical protein